MPNLGDGISLLWLETMGRARVREEETEWGEKKEKERGRDLLALGHPDTLALSHGLSRLGQVPREGASSFLVD